MDSEDIVFFPDINEEEFELKSKDDIEILKNREEIVDSIMRIENLDEFYCVIQEFFKLYLDTYKCLVDENLSLFEVNLNKIKEYSYKQYDYIMKYCLVNMYNNTNDDFTYKDKKNKDKNIENNIYKIVELLSIEDYFLTKEIDSITYFVENCLYVIYSFLKKYNKLNLENCFLSEEELKLMDY